MDLKWNHSLKYSRWDCFRGDFFRVKKMVHYDIGEQLGERGHKLYLYSCNGKRLGDFQCI